MREEIGVEKTKDINRVKSIPENGNGVKI